MSEADSGDITVLLRRWRSGEARAVEDLAPLVYDHLRSVAAGYLRRERSDHTLQATALVNELFMRLMQQRRAEFDSRVHFFTFAAKIMRRILVDHARSRAASKRGGENARLILSPELAWIDPESPQMLDLDAAMEALAAFDADKARVVDLRIFLGCTASETAELVGSSKATVDRDMRFAMAWLYDSLERGRVSQ